MTRAGLVQITSSDDPAANLIEIERLVHAAAKGGAGFVLTPEVSNIVSASRARQERVLHHEADDPTLARMRDVASELGIWLCLGSLAVKTNDADGRFANRQFLIGPDGAVVARYDKIHMFDVEIDGDDVYRESAGYRPGTEAVVTDAGDLKLGHSICYDMRFPALYRALAEAGAEVLLAPAAFTVPTGRAHWHTLLRARAIETGCFVLSAAQWGTHATTEGRVRETYGHSIAINPWGEVIADAGEGVGVTLVDLDLAEVAVARRQVPALWNAQTFAAPSGILAKRDSAA